MMLIASPYSPRCSWDEGRQLLRPDRDALDALQPLGELERAVGVVHLVVGEVGGLRHPPPFLLGAALGVFVEVIDDVMLVLDILRLAEIVARHRRQVVRFIVEPIEQMQPVVELVVVVLVERGEAAERVAGVLDGKGEQAEEGLVVAEGKRAHRAFAGHLGDDAHLGHDVAGVVPARAHAARAAPRAARSAPAAACRRRG